MGLVSQISGETTKCILSKFQCKPDRSKLNIRSIRMLEDKEQRLFRFINPISMTKVISFLIYQHTLNKLVIVKN